MTIDQLETLLLTLREKNFSLKTRVAFDYSNELAVVLKQLGYSTCFLSDAFGTQIMVTDADNLRPIH